MKVITAYSSKGGTTKTTTIANLGGYLVDIGFKVLLIDADHTQPSLSSYYPLLHQASDGLVRLIKSREIVPDLISHTSIPNLDIVYADDLLNELPSFINDATDGRLRIKRAIEEFDEKFPNKYDFIFIDTRGAKGLLVDSALIASDIIFSPITPDTLTAKEFSRGTIARHRSIADSIKFMDMKLGPIFAVMSRVERSNDSKTLTEAVRLITNDQDEVYLLSTGIPYSVAYKAATTSQTPIHLYDTQKYRSINNGADTIRALWEEFTHLYKSLNPGTSFPRARKDVSHA